jgi:hypothetical protein
MTNVSAGLTNLTALMPQSRDCSYYVSLYRHHSECRNTLVYSHTTSPTLLACDINLSFLNLHALEAGGFVELILL